MLSRSVRRKEEGRQQSQQCKRVIKPITMEGNPHTPLSIQEDKTIANIEIRDGHAPIFADEH